MTDIEMLPLPGSLSHWLKMRASDSEESAVMHVAVHHHARAVAEHNVRFLTHELANAECVIDAEQAGRKEAEAEIEALRAANIAYSEQVAKLIGRAGNAEARAERLAEALRDARQVVRDLLPDATYAKWDDALRDHDQEGKDG